MLRVATGECCVLRSVSSNFWSLSFCLTRNFAMNNFNLMNSDPFQDPFPFLDQFLNTDLSPHVLAEEFEQSISRENPFEEKENIEKLNGEIQDQKGAQNGPGQIEIRKGNSIQISLDEQLSGWIGAAVFHTNPNYRQNTITSPDSLCPFSLKGPGNVSSLGLQEVDGAGAAFVQAVQLENQDKIDISFNVISSHACSKYHH